MTAGPCGFTTLAGGAHCPTCEILYTARTMNQHNVFAGAFVDRTGHRREDPNWLAAAIESPDAGFVPIWGDKCLAVGEPFHACLL